MAKKKKFRLATLLKLREAERDARREQLDKALEALDRVQEQLASIEQQTQELSDYCRSKRSGRVDVDSLIYGQRYELVLRGHVHTLKEQEQAVADEIDKRRQALVEADRSVKTLEKLREKQEEAARAEELYREQNFMDEISQRKRERIS